MRKKCKPILTISKIINIAVIYVVAQVVKMVVASYTSFLQPSYGNWFLVGMVAWYLILPLASKIKPPVLLIIAIGAAILIGLDPQANTVLQTSRVVCFFPFFMLGFWCTKEKAACLQNKHVRWIGLCVLILAIVFCVTIWSEISPYSMMHASKSYAQMKLTMGEGCILRFIWYILACVAGFGVMAIIPRKKCFLTVFGTRTLPIFIIHTCVYLFLTKRTPFFKMLGEIENPFILVGVILLISFAITLICGNKVFANLFNRFMQYDFKSILIKNN